MEELKKAGCDFKLIVLGQRYDEVIESFHSEAIFPSF